MTYSIAVVDDDRQFVGQMQGFLSRYSEDEKVDFHVRTFSSGVDFITNYRPEFDVIFMDIEMPGFSGMETARELREKDQNVCLVFITNIAKYAIEGYSVSAMDFIVKPVDYFVFSLALKRALGRVRSRAGEKVMLTSKNSHISVSLADVVYIETDKHYLLYHVGDEVYRTRGAIGEALEKYAPHGFACCNSGCIVNMKYVTSFGNDSVTVGYGGKKAELSVSRNRKKDFLNALTGYLG